MTGATSLAVALFLLFCHLRKIPHQRDPDPSSDLIILRRRDTSARRRYSRPSTPRLLMDLRHRPDVRRVPVPPLFLAEGADPGETRRERQSEGGSQREPKGVTDVARPETAGVPRYVGAGVEDETEVDPEGNPLEERREEDEDEQELGPWCQR